MKNIDIKSLLIGGLLTSTIFLGVAATSKDDKGKWDDTQVWSTQTGVGDGKGWEPYAYDTRREAVLYRRRAK
jgi:hypothetical protein